MSSADDKLLLKLYRRQKSQRSQYVHIEAFKSLGGKSAFKELRKKGLVTFYKNDKVIGLTKDGALYAFNLVKESCEKKRE